MPPLRGIELAVLFLFSFFSNAYELLLCLQTEETDKSSISPVLKLPRGLILYQLFHTCEFYYLGLGLLKQVQMENCSNTNRLFRP